MLVLKLKAFLNLKFITSKMKKYLFLLLIIFATSCQVTETLQLNEDGSGNLEVAELRDEQSYMQLAKEDYSKEEVYKDTTLYFKDYYKKYEETFNRTGKEDQDFYYKYADVKVHTKKSSYEKEFKTTIFQKFKKVSDLVDLYKAQNYADDIKFNYSLAAEEHYYKVSYNYVGDKFNRYVKIIDSVYFKENVASIDKLKSDYQGYKLIQSYVLDYHFPRKIKSVSNPSAKISNDKKSVKLEFLLTDCLQNPEITNLKVLLESEKVD